MRKKGWKIGDLKLKLVHISQQLYKRMITIHLWQSLQLYNAKLFLLLENDISVLVSSLLTNRGRQALSVQFRFAFSKPSSSQTRFLNRPVAAPAEVAHSCRYKKKYFSTNLRFERWILETILLSTISTIQNANWPKNNFFGSDRSGLLRRAPQLDGLENEFANWTV